MKRITNECETLIIGTAREIKSLYSRMERNWDFCPVFADTPKFNMERNYGILIEEDGSFSVISEHTITSIMCA